MSCNSTPRLPKSRNLNYQNPEFPLLRTSTVVNSPLIQWSVIFFILRVRYDKAQTFYPLHLSVSKITKFRNGTMSILAFQLSWIWELRCHATLLLDSRNPKTQHFEMVLHLIVSLTRQKVSCPSMIHLLFISVFLPCYLPISLPWDVWNPELRSFKNLILFFLVVFHKYRQEASSCPSMCHLLLVLGFLPYYILISCP